MAQPSIALTSLSIRDFRGIETLDLDFRRPDGQPNSLVVLAGPNGSGKTAVLEAALIAAGGSSLIIGRQGSRAIRAGAADLKIVGGFRNTSSAFFSQFDEWPTLITSNSDFDLTHKVPHWYFSSWRAPELVGPVEVSVGRRGPKPRKNDTNRLKNIKRLLVDAAAFKDFKSRRKLISSSYEQWLAKIDKAWAKFYPEDPVNFVVDLSEDALTEVTGSFDIFLAKPGGQLLEVEALSAGQLELFLFLAALETISKPVRQADVTAFDTNRLHRPTGSSPGS